MLDAKVGRKLDPATEKEIGIYSRTTVKVSPLGKGDPVNAMTYQGVSVEKYHIPPTQHYMEMLVQGAYSFGLSMMWISYLQSFSTQVGRKPRPPAAATLRQNCEIGHWSFVIGHLQHNSESAIPMTNDQ